MSDPATVTKRGIHYRTVHVDGLEIFYREAGPVDAPTILLLHGFPTSSHIVWGKGDYVFASAGAEAYRRDLKTVELHLLDAGHFALETHAREISELIAAFLARHTDGSS